MFDSDGKLLREIRASTFRRPPDAQPAIGNKPDLTNYLQNGGTMTPGAPWAICITPPPNQVLYSLRRVSRAASTSSASTARFWACSASSGKQPKQFGWIHEIACPSENELYVAEILNWRVQKLMLHPEQQRSANH